MANKAFLVGINSYPTAPLSGCVNDVSMIAEMLVSKFGFQEGEVRLLVDSRATLDGILERLKWLVSDARPGDRVYFHYSGHGAQVATRDFQHEVDGLDEIICPVDFDWTSKFIRDKDFVSIFSKLPDGVKFNWTSDSCHSGDLTRDIQPTAIPRRIDPPVDLAWRARVASKMKMKPRSVSGGVMEVGFISGCQSNQTSSDTSLGGRSCGAFSHFLVQNLKKLPKTTPLAQLAAAISKDLAAAGYSQRPQVEGSRASKPFLG